MPPIGHSRSPGIRLSLLLLYLCGPPFCKCDAFVPTMNNAVELRSKIMEPVKHLEMCQKITRQSKHNAESEHEREADNTIFSCGNSLSPTQKTNSRRKFISDSIFSSSFLFLNGNKAQAACLSGDIREECIGVYKMPMDDQALSYVDTPEKLKRFAPDLNWVPPVEYPATYKAAIVQLKEQKEQLDRLQETIAKGELSQGGLLLLDIIPKVTAAGKVILLNMNIASNKAKNSEIKEGSKKNNNSRSNNDEDQNSDAINLDMKAMRIEYALNEVLGYLGETDVVIGQGMRGQLGVSAPAQIAILSSLSEARREFDELIRAVPDSV